MCFLTMKLPGITDIKNKKTGAKKTVIGLDWLDGWIGLPKFIIMPYAPVNAKKPGRLYDLLNLNY